MDSTNVLCFANCVLSSIKDFLDKLQSKSEFVISVVHFYCAYSEARSVFDPSPYHQKLSSDLPGYQHPSQYDAYEFVIMY